MGCNAEPGTASGVQLREHCFKAVFPKVKKDDRVHNYCIYGYYENVAYQLLFVRNTTRKFYLFCPNKDELYFADKS